jgi:hypothetical protein
LSNLTVKLFFPGHVPSKKNSKTLIKKGRATIPITSKAHKEWYTRVESVLEGVPSFPGMVKINYKIILPSLMKFDISNAIESINDLLVEQGVIKDDSWNYLSRADSEVIGYSPASGGWIVTIQEMEEPSWYWIAKLLSDADLLRAKAADEGITITKLKKELVQKAEILLQKELE